MRDYPEIADEGDVPCALIYEEYHVRKQAGDPVESQEYFERFPAQATELGRLLGMEAPDVTTSISGQTRLQELDVGQQIDDFDLLTRLGHGAFATVFLARQQSMQRIVALKVSADRGNEPQTMAQLDHPHIVRVYDQRRLPDRKLRLLYMQYIPGGTLQAVVERVKKTPAGQSHRSNTAGGRRRGAGQPRRIAAHRLATCGTDWPRPAGPRSCAGSAHALAGAWTTRTIGACCTAT